MNFILCLIAFLCCIKADNNHVCLEIFKDIALWNFKGQHSYIHGVIPAEGSVALAGISVDIWGKTAQINSSKLSVVSQSDESHFRDAHRLSMDCCDSADDASIPSSACACTLLVDLRQIEERESLIVVMGFEISEFQGHEDHLDIESETGDETLFFFHEGQVLEHVAADFVRQHVKTIRFEDDEGIWRNIVMYFHDQADAARLTKLRMVYQASMYAFAGSMVHGELLVAVGETTSDVTLHPDDSTPWMHLTWNMLDVTDAKAWMNIFGNPGDRPIRVIKLEHVLEHLSLAEAIVALKLMRKYVSPGGRIRLSVPDYNALIHGVWGAKSAQDKIDVQYTVRRRSGDARRASYTLDWPTISGDYNKVCRASAVAVEQCARARILLEAGALHQDILDGHHTQFTRRGLENLLASVGLEPHMLEYTDTQGHTHGPCIGIPATEPCAAWRERDGVTQRSSRGERARAMSLVVDGIVPREVPPASPTSVTLDLRPLEKRGCAVDTATCDLLQGILPIVTKHLAHASVSFKVLTLNATLADAAALPTPITACARIGATPPCDTPGGRWVRKELNPLYDETQTLARRYPETMRIELAPLNEKSSDDKGRWQTGVVFSGSGAKVEENKRVHIALGSLEKAHPPGDGTVLIRAGMGSWGYTCRPGFRPDNFYFLRNGRDLSEAKQVRADLEKLFWTEADKEAGEVVVDAPPPAPAKDEDVWLMVTWVRRGVPIQARLEVLEVLAVQVAAQPNGRGFLVLLGGPDVTPSEGKVLKVTGVNWLHMHEPAETSVRRRVYWASSLVVLAVDSGEGGTGSLPLDSLEAGACGARTLLLAASGSAPLADEPVNMKSDGIGSASSGGAKREGTRLAADPGVMETVKNAMIEARKVDGDRLRNPSLREADFRPDPLIMRALSEHIDVKDIDESQLWLREWIGWAPAAAAVVTGLKIF